jgi:hypothetical protein
MNRTEALKVLRLDGDSDGRALEQQYWGLVRRAQSRSNEARSRKEIERLNEAYALLAPAAEPQHVTARRAASTPASARVTPAPVPGFFFPDELLRWLGAESGRVRQRWSGRNFEIALIGGSALVLVVAALMAGASVALVIVCALLLGAAIWAPWRRSSTDARQPRKEP